MNGAVLLTGATGAVGPSVVKALLAAERPVRILLRPGESVNPQPGIEYVEGDITELAALGPACRGMEAVVHMAALLHEMGRRSDDSEYERVNVNGTANVIEAAKAARARRVVVLSTIAVYGDLRGETATEDTPLRPDTPYATTKVAAERLALSAVDGEGKPLATVLRAAAVYGARVKGNYRRLVTSLARGTFVPIGDGQNRRTLLFDEDLAAAIVLALESPQAAGLVFNVTDGAPHTVDAIVRSICGALGRRPPRLHVPLGLAMAASGVIERAAVMARRHPPITKAMLSKYVEDVAVSGARIEKQLGFRARHDLGSGWRATVSGLRAAGAL